MKKFSSNLTVAILACCLAFVVGCASYGNKIEVSKLDQIKKGVTTRAEVEALFGLPMNTSLLGDGRRMMLYNYHESQVKGQTFIPYAGAFMGGSRSRNQSLQIVLSKDNVVQDFEFNDTTGDTAGGAFNTKTTTSKTAAETP